MIERCLPNETGVATVVTNKQIVQAWITTCYETLQLSEDVAMTMKVAWKTKALSRMQWQLIVFPQTADL